MPQKAVKKLITLLISLFITTQAIAQTHTLVQGWNMEGNDNGAAVDPNAIFGNASATTSVSPSITTVWVWDKILGQWDFFAPSLTPTALGTYAASKGYGVLTSIPKGQGFWVNAASAVSVNLTATTTPTTGTGVTFTGTVGGYTSVPNTSTNNASGIGSVYVSGGYTVTTGKSYTWSGPINTSTQTLGPSASMTVTPITGLGTEIIVGFNYATYGASVACFTATTVTSSLCSSLGITLNSAAGTITFASTPISGTTITATGTLTFTPF